MLDLETHYSPETQIAASEILHFINTKTTLLVRPQSGSPLVDHFLMAVTVEEVCFDINS